MPVAITPFHLSCLLDMFVSHVEVSEVLGVFSQLNKVLFGVQMLPFLANGGNSADPVSIKWYIFLLRQKLKGQSSKERKKQENKNPNDFI